MSLRFAGRALSLLGLAVGVLLGVALMFPMHLVGIAWLIGVGLAKLTFVASLGLIGVDPKTKPASIDLIITEGADAGKTQPGLYELTDSTTLWIGLAAPGNTTRPSAIANAELQVWLRKTK